MTNTSNILDFDDNGRAVIEIPQIQHDYSLVLNHWQDIKSQLEEIEEDLSCCDTEGRRRFLEKARKLLLEYREKSEWFGEFEFKENEIDDKIDEVELKLSKSNINLDVNVMKMSFIYVSIISD